MEIYGTISFFALVILIFLYLSIIILYNWLFEKNEKDIDLYTHVKVVVVMCGLLIFLASFL